MALDNIPQTEILGVKVHKLTLPQALSAIGDLIRSRKNHYIVTPNPEMVMYARNHPWFKDVLNNASLSLADGVGLLWAAKYLSWSLINIPVIKQIQEFIQFLISSALVPLAPKLLNVIPERLTGADMVWEIAKLSSERGYRIFLLGAGPGVALKAARVITQLYPRINIVEVMVGPPYETEEEVLRTIKHTKPQIIFLAFPAPGQMKWIRDQLPKLTNTIAIGIGGGLDFIAEAKALNIDPEDRPATRAPEWMQRHGLEWLWRYTHQPSRKDRIKTATVDFMKAVRQHKLNS